jgi:hypothetical protein
MTINCDLYEVTSSNPPSSLLRGQVKKKKKIVTSAAGPQLNIKISHFFMSVLFNVRPLSFSFLFLLLQST